MASDLTILGGGCAGLSLALQLAKLGEKCPQITIIEARKTYTNDRTWCFWDNGSAFTRDLVQTEWCKCGVRFGEQRVELNCSATPYQMLPASVFYEYAINQIAQNPHINLICGVQVLERPLKINDLWHIHTTAGEITSKLIVDTRPNSPPKKGDAILWQSFLGAEILCEQDIFDESFVDLMAFYQSPDNDIAFVYCLPVSNRQALIEVTRFAPDPLGAQALQADLDAKILERVHNKNYVILRNEQGILPMGVNMGQTSNDATYIYAGLTAGGARPSTGYAFQRIQTWAQTCANALAEGKNPARHVADSWIMRQMDSLFLRVLRANPKIAPILFLSLFEKTDATSLIRFLSDQAMLKDYSAIIRALPARTFLMGAINAYFASPTSKRVSS